MYKENTFYSYHCCIIKKHKKSFFTFPIYLFFSEHWSQSFQINGTVVEQKHKMVRLFSIFYFQKNIYTADPRLSVPQWNVTSVNRHGQTRNLQFNISIEFYNTIYASLRQWFHLVILYTYLSPLVANAEWLVGLRKYLPLIHLRSTQSQSVWNIYSIWQVVQSFHSLKWTNHLHQGTHFCYFDSCNKISRNNRFQSICAKSKRSGYSCTNPSNGM